MIRYKCANCGAPLESPDSDTGKRDSCPVCQTSYEVPSRRTIRRSSIALCSLSILAVCLSLLLLLAYGGDEDSSRQRGYGEEQSLPAGEPLPEAIAHGSPPELRSRLSKVATKLADKAADGDDDFKEIDSELDEIEDAARSRLRKIDRSPGQQGYSMAVRREAAYRTFIEMGYSVTEARKTVQAMEEQGLLADPPR